MYARVTQFESERARSTRWSPAFARVSTAGVRRCRPGRTSEEMAGLEGVRRVMMLIDRDSGKNVSVMLCDTEDDLRKADEALNKMSPDGDVRRTSVGLYEVAIDQEMR